jgi:hypothetical protein
MAKPKLKDRILASAAKINWKNWSYSENHHDRFYTANRGGFQFEIAEYYNSDYPDFYVLHVSDRDSDLLTIDDDEVEKIFWDIDTKRQEYEKKQEQQGRRNALKKLRKILD